jgi:hypothetical protein
LSVVFRAQGEVHALGHWYLGLFGVHDMPNPNRPELCRAPIWPVPHPLVVADDFASLGADVHFLNA